MGPGGRVHKTHSVLYLLILIRTQEKKVGIETEMRREKVFFKKIEMIRREQTEQSGKRCIPKSLWEGIRRHHDPQLRVPRQSLNTA